MVSVITVFVFFVAINDGGSGSHGLNGGGVERGLSGGIERVSGDKGGNGLSGGIERFTQKGFERGLSESGDGVRPISFGVEGARPLF
ncbi:hypothetical protein LZD49_35250 [Dyadobacter sp. CY261]|uniref:hypothetical protein n=1 Tax=Dyadobacter sp. CY261 TaxID=2907203 RepID=UPI001F280E8B|nr:hypothetical protein [Dyadobacter sp. CY261]MCF0075781.1 hypothetical protein [Dyadobacter sp. CY261]